MSVQIEKPTASQTIEVIVHGGNGNPRMAGQIYLAPIKKTACAAHLLKRNHSSFIS